jgi:hypothetical protein
LRSIFRAAGWRWYSLLGRKARVSMRDDPMWPWLRVDNGGLEVPVSPQHKPNTA